jgi:hypothetical protein
METLARTGWRVAIIAGAVFPAIATFAQDAVHAPKHATPAAPDEPETERVVVTGTYIPVPTAESEGALPVANYSREQLTTFGANTPAEGLRHVPSWIGNTETENNSARGTGAAQVNPVKTMKVAAGHERTFTSAPIATSQLSTLERSRTIARSPIARQVIGDSGNIKACHPRPQSLQAVGASNSAH